MENIEEVEVQSELDWQTQSEERVFQEGLVLPSDFQVKQVVTFKPHAAINKLTATVRGVHFYADRVKYDLDLWLDHDLSTRIYNVDSAFVTKF